MLIHTSTPTNLLTDTMTVQRMAPPTPGVYAAEAWSDSSEDVPCSLQPMKQSKRVAYGGDRAGRMYTVFCSPTVSILDGDRLKITVNGVNRFLLVRSAPIDLVSGGAVQELDAEAMPGVSE